jgi:hypothetical protein
MRLRCFRSAARSRSRSQPRPDPESAARGTRADPRTTRPDGTDHDRDALEGRDRADELRMVNGPFDRQGPRREHGRAGRRYRRRGSLSAARCRLLVRRDLCGVGRGRRSRALRGRAGAGRRFCPSHALPPARLAAGKAATVQRRGRLRPRPARARCALRRRSFRPRTRGRRGRAGVRSGPNGARRRGQMERACRR